MAKLRLQTSNRFLECTEENKEVNIGDIGEDAGNTFMNRVLAVLDFYPQSLENIMLILRERFGVEMTQEEITTKMMYLCILGIVRQDSQGWYSKRV